jgi:restriction system protein
MAIPDYQACMLPLLRIAAGGGNHMLKEVLPTLADQFGLMEAERNELLPSGQENVFRNRVGWANTYSRSLGYSGLNVAGTSRSRNEVKLS